MLDWSADSGRSTLPALRAALMDYRQITPLLRAMPAHAPPELDTLARDVGQIWDAYQDSRYGYVTSRLPSLLAQAQSAGRAHAGESRQRAKSLLELTHQAAAMILAKLGETDLAWIAADRGLVAAQDLDWTGNGDPPLTKGETTPRRTLLGYDLSGPPTPVRLLTDWRIDVLFGPVAVLCAPPPSANKTVARLSRSSRACPPDVADRRTVRGSWSAGTLPIPDDPTGC